MLTDYELRYCLRGGEPRESVIKRQLSRDSWLSVSDKIYTGLLVHEIRCPYCGHKETFTLNAPRSCYICERSLSLPIIKEVA